ncbi:MAG: hypothetical protein ACM3NH_02585 [Candidatus Saccharibacteria bacterium]
MYNPIVANVFVAALAAAALGGLCQIFFVILDYPSIPGTLKLRLWLDRQIGFRKLKRQAEDLTLIGLAALGLTGLLLEGLKSLKFLLLIALVFQVLPLAFRSYCHLTRKLQDRADED